MKRIIFLQCFIILLFCEIGYSDVEFVPIKIGTITYGSEITQLGYEPDKKIPGAGFPSPITFEITSANQIYIFDWAKRRIAKYDLNLFFLEELKDEKKFGFIYGMKIDELGNIYTVYSGIYKHDNHANLICFIPDKLLSKTVFSHKNYFPHNGFLFYYNDDFTLACLDQTGKKLDLEKTNEVLTGINTQQRNMTETDSLLSYDIIDSFTKANKPYLFRGKRLYINNKEKYLKYLSFVQDKVKTNNRQFKEYSQKRLCDGRSAWIRQCR